MNLLASVLTPGGRTTSRVCAIESGLIDRAERFSLIDCETSAGRQEETGTA